MVQMAELKQCLESSQKFPDMLNYNTTSASAKLNKGKRILYSNKKDEADIVQKFL
jgi:hypothetical protein